MHIAGSLQERCRIHIFATASPSTEVICLLNQPLPQNCWIFATASLHTPFSEAVLFSVASLSTLMYQRSYLAIIPLMKYIVYLFVMTTNFVNSSFPRYIIITIYYLPLETIFATAMLVASSCAISPLATQLISLLYY